MPHLFVSDEVNGLSVLSRSAWNVSVKRRKKRSAAYPRWMTWAGMSDVTWYVYIIEAKNGNLYTGVAKNPEDRFQKHKEGAGAKFFRTSPPRKIVYTEVVHGERGDALRREAQIKKLSREEKLALIRRCGANG